MVAYDHAQNRTKGAIGELHAILFLKKKGYRILEQNYYVRGGEIDIIAEKSNHTIAFIEVKAREDLRHGMPYESVTKSKLHRLSKSIQFYLLNNQYQKRKLSLEVISIILNPDMTVKHIDHYDDLSINM
ncbi:MAG: YraN family protein [Candidatus Roizmanbacteria bacterium]